MVPSCPLLSVPWRGVRGRYVRFGERDQLSFSYVEYMLWSGGGPFGPRLHLLPRRLHWSAALAPDTKACYGATEADGATRERAAAARQGGLALPATLREGYVCCETNQKPLALLALLDAPIASAPAATAEAAPARGPHLVFTSSVDSARRVARLLELARAAAPAPRHSSR